MYFMIKYYLMEMFEPTLLYSLALSVLGSAAALYYGHFSPAYAVLVVVGSVLAQMSVNVISDYFDYYSGLDKELSHGKTGQLSGGSSLLASGQIKPGYTLASGIAAFLLAAAIGTYILYVQILVLPIVVIAALSILLYARYVKRVTYLSQPPCTVAYMFIALGGFIVVYGMPALPYSILFYFVPAGILLGGDALFVNEVPDRELDMKYGARHSAVMLKSGKNRGLYYLAWQSIAYAIVAAGMILGAVPALSFACLITLPTTFYVFRGIYGDHSEKYATYLKVHTMSSFAFALILSLSYILAA